MRIGILNILTILSSSFLIAACSSDYSPKPRGYFKIDLPEKSYQRYSDNCPYSFDYPVYAEVLPDKSANAMPCWVDISYPQFNGRIHLSYQTFNTKAALDQLTEDAYTFAYKHTVKATYIDEAIISYPERDLYGIYYAIDGNTASSVQFYLTDSSSHYLRGALYFNEKPRLDSIQPVLDFVKADIDQMIKSLEWKNK